MSAATGDVLNATEHGPATSVPESAQVGAVRVGTSVPGSWEVDTAVGHLRLTPVAAGDAQVLQGWLADPRSAFWQMGDLSVGEVFDYLTAVIADPAQSGWLGSLNGVPVVYVETYDPTRILLNSLPEVEPGDVGMHLLVAPPPADPTSGLTSALMGAVVGFCLDVDGIGARRVVVEPDVRNRAVHAKNAAAGFRVLREVELDDKTALLSVCTRADYLASPLGPGTVTAAHLAPGAMDVAHRHLVAKMIAELSHERLLSPEPVGAPVAGGRGHYRLDLTGLGGGSVYEFDAHVLHLEHWVVDESTVRRTAGGHHAPVDAVAAVTEMQHLLHIPDALLPTYLEEISATLAAGAAKTAQGGPDVEHLLTADFQQTEAAMTEGHPAFVANNGRIGFGLEDYRRYAPECGERLRVVWLAARREHTHLALGAGLDEQAHIERSLSPEERRAFEARLRARGLDPADYLYLPVHPWQWDRRVAVTFAPDVARGDLVELGPGAHEYQAQQSIRTLADRTDPARDYVKVALAIQNMGFLRGLSPAYMRAAPAINDWVADLVHTDPTLQAARFEVLREHATIGYTGDAYHRTPNPNPYRKMLAALWRESPVPRLAPGERLVTMAALLHRDADGRSYAAASIRASGLDARSWVREYLDVYLRPLVHCLLVHDLAFMPHGENLILGLRDHTPVRAFMKDIGEEIAVLSDRPLPADVERTRAVVDDKEKALAIFTDVYDGVLRHLAGILHVDGVLDQEEFWAEVRDCLTRYHADHPGIDTGVDLTAPAFAHSCLNRLQLRNTLQMVDLTDQSSSLIYAGQIDNPAAR